MRHSGGESVGMGTYWNFDSGERVDMSHAGVLPGNAKNMYYRMPAIGMVVAGPILGLLYAAFLPFIGIAMLLKLIVEKIGAPVGDAVRGTASFGWRPSESYLSGKRGRKGGRRNEEGTDKKTSG